MMIVLRFYTKYATLLPTVKPEWIQKRFLGT